MERLAAPACAGPGSPMGLGEQARQQLSTAEAPAEEAVTQHEWLQVLGTHKSTNPNTRLASPAWPPREVRNESWKKVLQDFKNPFNPSVLSRQGILGRIDGGGRPLG